MPASVCKRTAQVHSNPDSFLFSLPNLMRSWQSICWQLLRLLGFNTRVGFNTYAIRFKQAHRRMCTMEHEYQDDMTNTMLRCFGDLVFLPTEFVPGSCGTIGASHARWPLPVLACFRAALQPLRDYRSADDQWESHVVVIPPPLARSSSPRTLAHVFLRSAALKCVEIRDFIPMAHASMCLCLTWRFCCGIK